MCQELYEVGSTGDNGGMAGFTQAPEAYNEPIKSYAPETPERTSLKAALKAMANEVTEIPLIIGGERVTTGDFQNVVMPHDHQKVIAKAHRGTAAHVERAINAAEDARADWANLPWEDRASVFLKAAELLCGSWRARTNAATMLGQSKNVYQAEIDAVCELADFFRFNVAYVEDLMHEQPLSPHGQWNRSQLRSLDGFVFAVTPFNFSSIAVNLATAPALMGNTVIWKPAPTQLRAAYESMLLLEAAGLPPGVINMVHGVPTAIGDATMDAPELAGLHFTGSAATFQHLYGVIGKNIGRYRQYPRVVGETGGKDFIFAHATADVDALACAIVRGGFEYQGQKCSAVSRVYVPQSIWPAVKARCVEMIKTIKVGDIQDFSTFMGAVIDAKAFKKITTYVELAKGDDKCTVIEGGNYNDAKGWFVEPTLVETTDPKHRLMREEIFGPVVTVWPYENKKINDALELCDSSTPYGLTGAVFAQDRRAISRITHALSRAAGNFYINDKPTGAVVGQQPFGGSRQSGTNDKAGSAWNLLRWVSPRSIKENLDPPTSIDYPHMAEP